MATHTFYATVQVTIEVEARSVSAARKKAEVLARDLKVVLSDGTEADAEIEDDLEHEED